MKNLLTFGFLSIATLASAQSFEWDEPAPAAHPKEVVVADDAYDRAFNERQTGTAGIYAAADNGRRTAYGEIYRADEMTGSHPVLPLGTLLRVTNSDNGKSVVVRITDRGRECQSCVVTLSEGAAGALDLSRGGSVSLERSGFSNWNPLPPQSTNRVLAAYGTPALLDPSDETATPSGVVAPRSRTATRAKAPEQPSVFTREVSAETVAYQPTLPDPGESRVAATTSAGPRPTVAPTQQARGGSPSAGRSVAAAPSYAVQLAAYNNESYAQRKVSELQERGLDGAFYRSITKDGGEIINRVYVGTYANLTEAQAAVKEIKGQYAIDGIVAKM